MSERKGPDPGQLGEMPGRHVAESTASLIPHPRTIETDKQWTGDVARSAFANHVFERVSAKGLRFTNVDFKYSVFDGCYLRSCTFESCDFTGCRFVGSNFHGSTFSGCTFDYALFERTLVDPEILDTSPPPRENLRLRFARTLRTNYQALGDSDAVNKAILVELRATEVHLSMAWRSDQRYYREKYSGPARIGAFFTWLRFRASELIWGNGERASNLLKTSIVLIALAAVVDTFLNRNIASLPDWVAAFVYEAQVFLGTTQPTYPGPILIVIALIRYVVIGLFVSALVRRLARR